MKSKLTKADVLDMLKLYGPRVIQPDDITLEDIKNHNGWGASAAKKALKRLVAEGKLETMIVIGNKNVRCRVWRPK